MTSCNGPLGPDTPTPSPTPEPDPIPVNISLSLKTRATDTAYDNGDQIGLYMVYDGSMQSSDNYIDNKKYTLNGAEWKGDGSAYWKDDSTPADFYCYHPYGNPSDALAYDFSVKADQSDLSSYKASDFLWGKTSAVKPTENTVAISTSHIMSNIVVVLEPGSGFTEEEFDAAAKSVSIGNVKLQSTINLSNGAISPKGQPSAINAYNDGESYKAVIVPQTVPSDDDMLIVTVAGVRYSSKEEFTFKPQTRHQFTVVVDKTSTGLDITVEDWKIDPDNHTSIVN